MQNKKNSTQPTLQEMKDFSKMTPQQLKDHNLKVRMWKVALHKKMAENKKTYSKEELRKMPIKQRSVLIAEEMIANLKNPLLQGKTI